MALSLRLVTKLAIVLILTYMYNDYDIVMTMKFVRIEYIMS